MVIADGSADVKKDGRLINVLDSGDFLGEIALISDAPADRDRHDVRADAAARADRPRLRAGHRRDAVDPSERA